jgi:hypothetical protein
MTVFAGRVAYFSAALSVAAVLLRAAFYIWGRPFGTVSDIATVFLGLSFIPLALAVRSLYRESNPGLGLLALLSGVLGGLGAAAFETLLIFRQFSVAIEVAWLPAAAFAATGVWLLTAAYLPRARRDVPKQGGWLAALAAAGYLLLALGLAFVRYQRLLTLVGAFASAVGYPLCALWLGRFLLMYPTRRASR